MRLTNFKMGINLIYLVLAVIWPASAQSMTSVVSAVDLVEMTWISKPAESPDGRYVVYLKQYTDWDKDRHINRYVLHDRQTGETDFILEPEKKGESFQQVHWAPNSQQFLVVLKTGLEQDSKEVEQDRKQGKRQAYLYTLETKELQQLSFHQSSVRSLQWASDGSGFYFLADQVESSLSESDEFEAEITVFDEPDLRELWFFDLNKAKSNLVLSGDFSIRDYQVLSGKNKLMYRRSKTALPDDRHSAELWMLDTETGQQQQLTENNHAESKAALSPAGNEFAFIAEVNRRGEPYYEDNLFVQSVREKTSGKKPELLFPDKAMEVLDFAWAGDGNSLLILGNTGLTNQLYRYQFETEQLEQLTQGQHSIRDWSYSPDTNHHLFVREDQNSPGELFSLNANGQQHRITGEFDWLHQKKRLPKQEAFTWKAADSQLIEGLLVYPVDYVAGDSFPLVTITHGGPRTSAQFGSWRKTRSRYLAVLAGQGYGIFLPNHRGGTGYGDEFMRDMVGGYFNKADDDVMSGIDALIDAGLADEDQLIKQGWSAGGHMTNWLITQTDRFKAASSGAGAADWVSMYGESDIRYSRSFNFGGSPWQKRPPLKTYQKQSPLFQAHKITTPTLFWTGENDVRVPPTQSILMYRAARDAGVDTHLYIADDEPHNFSRPSSQLFKINTDLAWFARHLGLPEYQPSYPQNSSYPQNPSRPEVSQAEGK